MFVLSVAVLTTNSMAKISWTTVYSTLQSSPTPLLLQALQHHHFQGNWKQMTPSLLKQRTSDSGMIWDFVATFQGSAI